MILRLQGWTLLLLALGTVAPAGAASWQPAFADAGRNVQIDRAGIHKEEGSGKLIAWARILFDKPVPDVVSGHGYRVLEAMNRYDCEKRSFATLKRIYRQDESQLLREEEGKNPTDLPARSGTLDDKILRVVCRPPEVEGAKVDFTKLVKQVNDATGGVRKVNEDIVRKEVMRTDFSAVKTAAAKPAPAENEHHAAAEPAARPSLRTRSKRKAEAHEEHAIHWSYEGAGGPENWAQLKPENRLCESGQRQSPIDIREGIQVDLAPIEFRYRPAAFQVLDNGHTVQVMVGEQRMSLLGKDYRLIQFHFHRPAEERIGGRGFAMVAHLVHQSDDGRLAVVAVMLEPGREHPLIQTLWNNLPLEKNETVAPPMAAIDLNQLLPDNRSYLTYMGSLTTPPCSEGVLWLVMKQPVEMAPEQIAIFSRLYRHNARPIQAANGRLIKESR